MNHSNATPVLACSFPASGLIVAATLAALAGCHTHVGFTPIETIAEQEPNDHAYNAQGIGPVGPGNDLIIHGYASGLDTDGFAFVATADVEVRVELVCYDPFADLDLCVWDPFLGSYVLCLTSPGDEYGSFTVSAGYEFHLVVDAFFMGADYDLRVEVDGALLGFSTAADDEDENALQSPIRPLTSGADFKTLEADRRVRFERYSDEPRTEFDPRVTFVPAMPGSPLLPMPLITGR